MKKEDKKVEAETVCEAQEGEVSEAEESTVDLGIDRANMSDTEYISALEMKLGQSIAELGSCKAVAMRLQADFDNYRKRNTALADSMKTWGQTVVIEKMLVVLDNCELARKYLQDEAALTGFNMMEKQILDALEGFGLKAVDADGVDFDAKLMTAVERVKCEDKQGKVVEVLAKGYTLNGKLLRPASVKVGYWE
ncbi:MAG: nucleotide exchange factor GrpE [Clostridia bacterium]|nr:nucleotide exchange factor GrpE [Clostridia bacterium]